MKEYITTEEKLIGRFTSWIDIIARRTRYDYIKKEARHTSHVCIDDVPEDAFLNDEVEMSYTFTERKGKFNFEAEWLIQGFEELSKTHKRLLELLYIEEKTPQEAANELGCSVENIYNQRSKAFKIIKKIRREGQTNEDVE